MGCYIFKALEVSLGNIANAFSKHPKENEKYLEKPFDLYREKTEEEKREERERAIQLENDKVRASLDALARAFNK